MALKFLSNGNIDGALTVNNSITLSGSSNAASTFTLTNTAPTPDSTWTFVPQYNSLDLIITGAGKFDVVSSGGTGRIDTNGQIESIQALDVATAGGRLTGKSNRGYLASIHLEQTATSADGGYIRFLTAASGTTSGLERFKITETGAFSVGPSGTNYGTSGQVLTSQGNALPTWTTPTTGTITGSGTTNTVSKFTGATAIGDGPITFATNDSTFAGAISVGGTITCNNVGSDKKIAFRRTGGNNFSIEHDTSRIYFYNETTPANMLTILNGGNVGIGTASPEAKLDISNVAGATYALEISTPERNRALFYYNSASTSDAGYLGIKQGSVDALNHRLATTGNSAVCIEEGNFGIGTDSPNKALTVYGGNDNGIWIDSQGAQYTSLAFGHNGSEKANISWDNTNGYTNISTYGNGHLALTTGGGIKAFLSYSGNFGIGTTGPSYKLDVTDFTQTQGLLNGATIEDVKTSTYFTHGTANLNFDIDLGNISYWGELEVSITGSYSNQNTPGRLTRIYALGLNANNVIYTNSSRISESLGEVAGNVYLDVLRWDSATSTYKIRVAHLNSNGNAYNVRINGFTYGAGYANLVGWSLTGLYTQSVSGLSSQYPYYNDKLGIGTTAPTTALSVSDGASMYANNNYLVQIKRNATNGNDDTSKASILLANNSNAFQIAYGGATDRLRFINGGGTEQMTLLNGGNVGIGTTAPGYKLDVVGDSGIYTNLTVGYQPVTSSTTNYEHALRVRGKNNYSDGTNWYGTYGQILLHSDTNMTGSAKRFLITNALNNNKFAIVRSVDGNTDPVVDSTGAGVNSGTADFVINNSGNIGIGETSPSYKLHLAGPGGAGGPLMRFDNTSGSSASGPSVDFGYSGQTWRAGANIFAAGDFALYDTGNSTHLLLINNAGDFGIGTTNPGAISGGCTTMTFGSTAAALSGGVLFQANGTNVNGTYWESNNMRYQNVGDYSHTFYKNNSTVLFTIATTGTVTATGDVVAYSDERLKSDIKTLDGSKVLKMRGVSFKKEGKKGSGVIAQELEKIAPELVNNDSEYKGVAYGNLSGYLIEAIKEQQKQIDRLEEQIKKMSSKN